MTLGERIRIIRERRGWSQNELARRARVTQALISELESGKRKDVTGRTLRRLAESLGVTTDYLIGMHLDEGGDPTDLIAASYA